MGFLYPLFSLFSLSIESIQTLSLLLKWCSMWRANSCSSQHNCLCGAKKPTHATCTAFAVLMQQKSIHCGVSLLLQFAGLRRAQKYFILTDRPLPCSAKPHFNSPAFPVLTKPHFNSPAFALLKNKLSGIHRAWKISFKLAGLCRARKRISSIIFSTHMQLLCSSTILCIWHLMAPTFFAEFFIPDCPLVPRDALPWSSFFASWQQQQYHAINLFFSMLTYFFLNGNWQFHQFLEMQYYYFSCC